MNEDIFSKNTYIYEIELKLIINLYFNIRFILLRNYLIACIFFQSFNLNKLNK